MRCHLSVRWISFSECHESETCLSLIVAHHMRLATSAWTPNRSKRHKEFFFWPVKWKEQQLYGCRTKYPQFISVCFEISKIILCSMYVFFVDGESIQHMTEQICHENAIAPRSVAVLIALIASHHFHEFCKKKRIRDERNIGMGLALVKSKWHTMHC